MITNNFKLLVVGDVVGEAGVSFLQKNLWRIRNEYSADLVIANGENCAKTNGLSKEGAEALFAAGVDIITSGNHIFKRKEIYSYLDEVFSVLRPANYPASCPGQGYVIKTFAGFKVLIINLLGVLFMESLASPFDTAEEILKKEDGKYDFAIVDIHAEATSEKLSFAYNFDGRINVIFGTHTHVQTADAQILPKGTGYITDLGMTGSKYSVLGVKPESAIERFITKMPVKYESGSEPCMMSGAFFEINEKGKIVSVKPVREE